MFKQIAIDKPILFLILKRIPRGILVIAEHDCLIFIDMMAEETFGGTGNQLVLGTIENANVIKIIQAKPFYATFSVKIKAVLCACLCIHISMLKELLWTRTNLLKYYYYQAIQMMREIAGWHSLICELSQ